VKLAPYPADHAERLAKVDLSMTRRMRQRHEHLPHPSLLLADVVGDDRQFAREAMFVAQPLEDPLRRMPLLLQLAPVVLQDLVDDRDERVELRSHRWLRSSVSRRHGMLQNLPDRLAVDVEHSRRFALAHPLDVARPAHPTVQTHGIHLPAFSSLPQAKGAEILLRDGQTN